MNVAGFFAGVGGIELGFKQAGFNIVYANEIDNKAAKTYNLNNKTSVVVKDINDISCEEVPDADVIVGGFPCQAFSIAGYRKGFEDERGEIFFQLARIIKHKNPRIILLKMSKFNWTMINTYKVIKTLSYGYELFL